jgi:opacity protein-like surface antigen
MKSSLVLSALVLSGLMCLPTPARADGFIAPMIGVNVGADANHTLVGAADEAKKLTYGVAGGYMSKGIFGVEENFAYSPSFYGSGGGFDTKVITLMTNLIVGVPVGGTRGAGIRPFGTIGVGLVSQRVTNSNSNSLNLGEVSSNDFGYDIGAGVMGYFNNRVGLRGGVQYFRNFRRTDDNKIGLGTGEFNFFRVNVGVLFRF